MSQLDYDRMHTTPTTNQEQQELFLKIHKHLLEDEKPSGFLEEIALQDIVSIHPFSMLLKMKDAMQSKQYHPEGNVWNHTMLVVNEAARMRSHSKEPAVLMWAALLHDIGKPDTTKERKGKITSYNHERVGAELTADFLSFFTNDTDWINKVSGLVRWHMEVLYLEKNLPFGNVNQMIEEVDLHEIGLLALCDRLGRTGAHRQEVKQGIERFLKACKQTKINSKQNRSA